MIIQPYKAQQEAQEIATEEMRTQWEEKQKQLAPVITDSIEVVEIAEGISEEVGSHLQRMKELAEEVASGGRKQRAKYFRAVSGNEQCGPWGGCFQGKYFYAGKCGAQPTGTCVGF